MQGFWSSQASGVWVQPASASQPSKVHGSPSSQEVPWTRQPKAGWQVTTAQGSSSGQTTSVWVQPLAGSQASSVQASPSEQSAGAAVHPPAIGSQASAVQGSPSSGQETGVNAQPPASWRHTAS